MSMSEGGIPDSNVPQKTRAAINELYPLAAATHAVAIPQANRVKLRNFAAGIRCSRKTEFCQYLLSVLLLESNQPLGMEKQRTAKKKVDPASAKLLPLRCKDLARPMTLPYY